MSFICIILRKLILYKIYRFMMADCSYLSTYYNKLTLNIDYHIH